MKYIVETHLSGITKITKEDDDGKIYELERIGVYAPKFTGEWYDVEFAITILADFLGESKRFFCDIESRHRCRRELEHSWKWHRRFAEHLKRWHIKTERFTSWNIYGDEIQEWINLKKIEEVDARLENVRSQ
jgi:hypothetical protein